MSNDPWNLPALQRYGEQFRPRRRWGCLVTLAAVLVGLALPAVAGARGRLTTLSLARGTVAITQHEQSEPDARIFHCHTRDRLRVVCAFTQEQTPGENSEPGWTEEGQLQARLIVHRQVIVIELVHWAEPILAIERV